MEFSMQHTSLQQPVVVWYITQRCGGGMPVWQGVCEQYGRPCSSMVLSMVASLYDHTMSTAISLGQSAKGLMQMLRLTPLCVCQ